MLLFRHLPHPSRLRRAAFSREREKGSRDGTALAASFAGSALLLAVPCAAAEPGRPAASMGDLRDHFAACLQPPDVASTRLTFYFSLDAYGRLFGRPRTIWFGFKGDASERRKRLTELTDAFRKCLPVALDRRLAAGIAGEVYFLQYVVGADGREQQVLFRPFGSHGGIGPSIGAEPIEPGQPSAPSPDPRRFQPFRPQPGEGPFFNPPVIPFGRRR